MATPTTASQSTAAPARLVPLTGYYLLYFCTVGLTLPYLPAYLKSLHFSATEVGVLLALGPTMAMFAPPFWGGLADRTGRPDRTLAAISFGAALCFAPLLFVDRFVPVFLIFAAYAFFQTSITPIVDSIALHRVSIVGGSYSRLRLFGSIGFVIAALGFGFSVSEVDRRTVIACVGFMIAYALWSLTIRAPVKAGIARHPLSGLRLLKHRDLALLLAATGLHWIGCAPYHGTFAIHVASLQLPPSVIGAATSVGVVAEILAFLLYPKFADRIAPRHLLAISFAMSAVRWALLGFVQNPYAVASLQALHFFTFGTFYVASIAFMARRVPVELRASGQALFVAITFGLGGLIGYVSAGMGYDLLGGPRNFLVGAGIEVLAALLVLQVPPVEIPAEPHRPLAINRARHEPARRG